jgi:hypothetical protein
MNLRTQNAGSYSAQRGVLSYVVQQDDKSTLVTLRDASSGPRGAMLFTSLDYGQTRIVFTRPDASRLTVLWNPNGPSVTVSDPSGNTKVQH